MVRAPEVLSFERSPSVGASRIASSFVEAELRSKRNPYCRQGVEARPRYQFQAARNHSWFWAVSLGPCPLVDPVRGPSTSGADRRLTYLEGRDGPFTVRLSLGYARCTAPARV